jgi:hypothetical protein
MDANYGMRKNYPFAKWACPFLLGGLLPWCLERARSRILQIYLQANLIAFGKPARSKVRLKLWNACGQ